MLSRRANFTFQKPKSNELLLSLESINSKRHRSTSRSLTTKKATKKRSTSSNGKDKKRIDHNSSIQKKMLELVGNISFSKNKPTLKNDENDENDESVSILEIIQSLFSQRGNVFRENNHIYFRGEVTMSGVNELCDLIQQINDESAKSKFTDMDPIFLHITSMGGDLLAGFMAFDCIKNSTVPVYTIVDGFAVSSGANMFMAGKKRFMRTHSYLLIHQLNQFRCENETSLNTLDNAENVSEFMSKLYNIYLDNIRHNRTNVPESDILTKEKLMLHMHHDIFWNFDTCSKYGLVDSLYTNINDIENKSKKSQKSESLISILFSKPNVTE